MSRSFPLEPVFDELNALYFDGLLDPLELKWNARLRVSAGRFVPGVRKFGNPSIEVASYLIELPDAAELIRDTLGHEMIHYWLWMRRRPYGHTEEFYSKMQEMGVSRFNPVPQLRPYKYLYHCPSCQKTFPARKKLGAVACLDCCKAYARGRFDRRFRLELAGPVGGVVELAL